jgi:hypothetical protein
MDLVVVHSGKYINHEPVRYPNAGGYQSLDEMRRELTRRFKSRKIAVVENGIQYDDGIHGLCTVTLEP